MSNIPIPNIPMPNITPTSQPYWEALNEGKVSLQQCDDCQTWVYYPRSHCPNCLSDQLTWKEVSGEATLYSFTIARRPTAPPFAGTEPQFIGVVELSEGVRMNSVIVNVSETDLAVGMKLQPVFDTSSGEQALLYFEPAS